MVFSVRFFIFMISFYNMSLASIFPLAHKINALTDTQKEVSLCSMPLKASIAS